MHQYRSIPPLEDMPETYLERGHFWIQEYIVGRVIGFEMAESGLVTVGSEETVFETDSIPLHLRRGVEAVQQDLDRDRLRAGTDDPEAYTFFGVVPVGAGIEYDWESIPPFLGVDIWDERDESYVPEDVVERVFDSVGLERVPTFEKEVPARSFNPRTYEIPESTWTSEQAAGVVLRKKHGEPARLIADSFEAKHPAEVSIDARPSAVREWVDERVGAESVRSLRTGRERTPHDGNIDELAADIASELARREYETLVDVIDTDPDRLVTAVHERLRENRRLTED